MVVVTDTVVCDDRLPGPDCGHHLSSVLNLGMFFKICSVSRQSFFRRSCLPVATLAQVSMPSTTPGPMESSILDKVSFYVAISIAFFLITLQAHSPFSTLGALNHK